MSEEHYGAGRRLLHVILTDAERDALRAPGGSYTPPPELGGMIGRLDGVPIYRPGDCPCLLGPRPGPGVTDTETDLDELLPGEERFDYGDGLVAYQRRCSECEAGLLSRPARWCPVCGGSGYRVRWLRPDGQQVIDAEPTAGPDSAQGTGGAR